MFIQTRPEADSDVMTFLPGREVLSSGAVRFQTAQEAAASPLAMRFFSLEGIRAVAFDEEGITLSKAPEKDWMLLKSAILGIIMEHYLTGGAIIEEAAPDAGIKVGEDSPQARELKDLIDTRIRPAVQSSGGNVTFRGFVDGAVYLELEGAAQTLRDRIEAMLKHYVPEVESIRDYIDVEARPGLATPAGEAVRAVLDNQVNPAVASHGGYIALVDVQEDTVYIRLEGGCQGCGMADVTLKQGIEGQIRRAVPEIARVLDVTDHAGGTNPYYQPGKGGASAV